MSSCWIGSHLRSSDHLFHRCGHGDEASPCFMSSDQRLYLVWSSCCTHRLAAYVSAVKFSVLFWNTLSVWTTEYIERCLGRWTNTVFNTAKGEKMLEGGCFRQALMGKFGWIVQEHLTNVYSIWMLCEAGGPHTSRQMRRDEKIRTRDITQTELCVCTWLMWRIFTWLVYEFSEVLLCWAWTVHLTNCRFFFLFVLSQQQKIGSRAGQVFCASKYDQSKTACLCRSNRV